ncbi:hypothetical protein IWX90DRAFT_127946 [Phyllosticta citrichinensis]|uniref:Heterokaryon incompatibility domain-containing protein n=1 Tax=Phyllosticta citrichinensis TaxID=1130410 RepID=A0ABR1Y4H8_9PEZI
MGLLLPNCKLRISLFCPLGTFHVADQADPSIPAYRPFLPSSTGSAESFTQLQTWLECCLSTHDHCTWTSSRFVPSRLLKLENKDCGKTVSLVLSHECPQGTRYMTLSHCWGSRPIETKLRLLTDTCHIFRQGISLNSLPKTFRDCFRVLEMLNVQYLWIDCLCIVQDSRDDWTMKVP